MTTDAAPPPPSEPITVQSLKAVPLARRYDAMREVIETGGGVEDESLPEVFRKLCTRRSWPKGKPEPDGGLPHYGSANRWNFNPEHRIDSDDSKVPFKLPPSLTATSPDALYRLLQVVRPGRIVAGRSDYYKGGMFRFFSADRRYVCWVGFHHRELELSFYCPAGDLFIPSEPEWPFTYEDEAEERLHRTDPTKWVQQKFAVPGNREKADAYKAARKAWQDQGLIVPWCSRRMKCARPAGQAWMRLIVAVANTPWNLYYGNNLRV